MEEDFKGFDCLNRVMEANPEFARIVNENIASGKIRYFGDDEWDKIKNQNYMSQHPLVNNFYDVFRFGGNEGNCTGASRQMSYSYSDIAIVGGVLPILIGTRNCPDGSHTWLETDTQVIDPSLLLVIDKSLKEEIGYQTENVCTYDMLSRDPMYGARKEFATDLSLRCGTKRQ